MTASLILTPKRVAVQNRHRETVEVRFRFGCGRAHLGIDCDNDNPDRAYPEPLPKSSKAGLLRKRVERYPEDTFRAFAFSSVVVIGNTLRRLASVLLLRQSQPPHGLALAQAIMNWCGLPITRRSVFSRFQSLQKSQRGLFDSFQSFLCFFALVHNKDSSEGMLKCAPKEFPKPEKEIPRMT